MAEWYRTIVGTRSKLSLERLRGKLADGIVFLPLSEQDIRELKDHLDLEDRGYSHQLLLLAREDVVKSFSPKNINKAFFHLAKLISIHMRIGVDPDSFIIKPQKVSLTKTEIDDNFRWNNIYSDAWPKLNEAYKKHKTTFELFSAATVTDRTDVTYNIVNSVISLESILLNGEKVENAYKLRMRGLFLLAGSVQDRKLMHDFLKYAYEMRSSIVHSNDDLRRKIRRKFKDEYGLSLYEVNKELIKINRHILKLYLNDPDIITKLDDIILAGGYSGSDYKNQFMTNRISQRHKTFMSLARKRRGSSVGEQ